MIVRAIVDININSATYPSRQIFHDGSETGGNFAMRFRAFPKYGWATKCIRNFAIICSTFSNTVGGSHMLKFKNITK